MMPDHTQILKEIYYNPQHPAGFGGAARLSRAAGVPLKTTQKWLKSQDAYTLHKPARQSRYKTRKYHTGGIDHQWQADLVDMQVEAKHNDGYKYILTVIDIFSRYAWAMPVKTKSPQHVKPAFEAIFNMGRKPFKIQTDQGLEFESKTMKDFFTSHKIHQFSVKSQFKAAIVERLNRTLKKKMWTYFTHENTRKWLEILPQIVKGYNDAHHRSIDMTPAEVTKEEEFPLWLRDNKLESHAKSKFRIKVGDHVRLNIARDAFRKGYYPNWTEEVFIVVSVSNRDPIQIEVKDYDGNVIDGKYYKEEVQVVKKPEMYRIESVLQTRGAGARKQYLVKWLGYPSHFNSWVGEADIKKFNG